jgi:hypothetical protein
VTIGRQFAPAADAGETVAVAEATMVATSATMSQVLRVMVNLLGSVAGLSATVRRDGCTDPVTKEENAGYRRA